MKLVSTEHKNKEKTPFTARVLEWLGVAQFFGASWFVFSFTGLFRQQLGPEGVVVGLVLAISLGITASLIPFVVARILIDLHNIRAGMDAYDLHLERKDLQMLQKFIDVQADNIAHAMRRSDADAREADLSDAPVPDDPADAPVDETDAPDPYDEFDEPAPAPSGAPSESRPMISGVALKLLYVLAGLMVVAIAALLFAILTR